MKKYIFRNSAVEYLFDNSYDYSGYSDVSIKDNYDEYYFCYFIDYIHEEESIINSINNAKYNFDYVVSNIKNKKIYVFTLFNYFYAPLVLSNNIIENKINEFNNYIYNYKNNVYVIDIKDFFIKNANAFNNRFYYNYNAIISPTLKNEFSNWFNKEYKKINQSRKKCLIIDFDNTIWNGILGEDGVNGISFTGTYPSNIYGEVQKMIKEVKNSGIILCGVTKNNQNDVDELFEIRKDMYLKKDDFTIIKSSWDNKVKSIEEIVKKLNIGMDSVVFIDDNNFETDLVKSSLKDITTILLPEEKYLIPSILSENFKDYFSVYNISNEDLDKSEMYKNIQKAEELKLRTKDYKEFLKELNMKLEISYMNDSNIDRIIQLINKSNQFNLTTKRYTKEELLNSITINDYVYSLKVGDKFGDLGICGVCIIKKEDSSYFIDEFLLSCRVIGRTVEEEFLKVILNDLYNKKIKYINSEYIRTSKNSQVEDFYDKFGFKKYEYTKDYKKYKIDVKKYRTNKDMEIIFNGK